MGYTMGSLFDGSGGFPLAASLCGITPIWASEVEPYPIAVTRSRLPAMKHLEDITKVNREEIEPVDLSTFGSPCQDLSVAGQRKGLKHEDNGDDETTRSGLFMEAIRIIKEMRGATNGRYPAFAIFENVQGAFSSNKGEDFRIVLEEFVKIVEPTAKMPAPDKNGWAYADIVVGDGWSIAYRLVDAQYWGVPQRRRRIYLVADFRGERAGERLFKQERLSRHYTQGGTPWQGATADVEGCIGTDDSERSGVGFPLGFRPENVRCYDARGNGDGATVNTITGDHNNRVTDYTSLVCEEHTVYCLQGNGIDRADTAGCNGKGRRENQSYTLNTLDRPAVSYGVDCRNATEYEEVNGTLQAKANGGFSYNCNQVVRQNYIVRRLTPTECARLQGFPDKWGHPDKKDYLTDSEYRMWHKVRNTFEEINGKKVGNYNKEQMLKWYNKLHSDSAEYKMWGNGIALPNALYVMQGIADALKEKENAEDTVYLLR